MSFISMENDINYQKDTEFNSLKSQGHETVINLSSSLANNKINEDISISKTEKLITALYMVTDCMDESEPMKSKLRTLGVSLVSEVYKTIKYTPVETHLAYTNIVWYINEVISLLSIAETVGLIGVMNTAILKREFSGLKKIYTDRTDRNMIIFNNSLFKSDPIERFSLNEDFFTRTGGKQEFKGQQYKGHQENVNSKEQILKDISYYKKDRIIQKSNKVDIAIKYQRRNTIISLIKDKKEITVKDITSVIKDCSEKTLQRELQQLVSDGVLKKTGEKRWSKYSLK